MQIRTMLQVSNNIQVVDREDDDCPLIDVRFHNEASRLTESDRIVIGKEVARLLTQMLQAQRAAIPPHRGR